jgi:8-oxo-dGTP diphosphatase
MSQEPHTSGESSPGIWFNCALAVDIVLLTIRHEQLHVLLVTRSAPKAGQLALPGGFVLANEGLRKAALRELTEETSIPLDIRYLEQLRTYGRPDRDPRGRVVSVAYLAITPDLPDPRAGTDAIGASWQPVQRLLATSGNLAFDHDRILADGVERARSKLEYTTVGTAFCPADFTVAELRRIYEIVWGESLDPRNFHRKLTSTDFLVPTGETSTRDGGRPAALYRVGGDAAGMINPPLLRKVSDQQGHPAWGQVQPSSAMLVVRWRGHVPHCFKARYPVGEPPRRVCPADHDMHAVGNAIVLETVAFEDHIATRVVGVDDDQAESRIDRELPVAKAWLRAELSRCGERVAQRLH